MNISPAVRHASRFEDLLAIRGGDGPYVFTRMFRESDREQRRQSRRHFKLLRKLDGVIREIVGPDEKIVFLTEAPGFSFWERWVLGWRRAVVLTDSRAVFLQLDAARRPRLVHEQITYGVISRIDDGRGGEVEVRTRNGDRLTLRQLRRADRAIVAETLRASADGHHPNAPAGGIERLCPYCHRGLSGRPRSCPGCLRKFRRGWLSAFFSLAIPGLGDYRIGYRGFAVLEISIALTVWAAYLFGLRAWGIPGVRSALNPGWIFTAVHGGDALLAWHVARSGVFPSARG